MVNVIETTLEVNKIYTGVFLVVEKAFDKVWHQGLLYKIKKCFTDHYYWLFTSYLKDSYFQVKVEGDFSHTHAIRSGVPQGSILGPFLYSLKTSRIFQLLKIHLLPLTLMIPPYSHQARIQSQLLINCKND